MLIDTHHHLDFVPVDLRPGYLHALSERGVQVVAQTLTPSGFVDGVDSAWWSLGFHPWHLGNEQDADRELAVFDEAVGQARFIGEIGLDFSPRRVAEVSEALQVRVLRRILGEVCAVARDTDEPYVMSIHAVRSASVVLDLLVELGIADANVVPVMHWFSGTSDDLTRLVRLGGYASAHPQMLATKRGRAYLKQVPADRLLLETDLPTEPGDHDAHGLADEVENALKCTVAELSELRGRDMGAEIARTQTRLYGV